MDEPQIWIQRNWKEAELQALGFGRYETQREIRMARLVSERDEVDITNEKLDVEAGYMLCYNPGKEAKATLKDYDHWPVRFDLFHKNYKPWSLENWRPNAAEKHLMENGCKPFYKAAPVWAKRLKKPVSLQSLESQKPVEIPAGRWLCIGLEGEPYHMGDAKFRAHYRVPVGNPFERIYWSMMNILGRAEL